MPFSRVLLGWITVTVFLAIWRELERRLHRTPGGAGPAIIATLPAIATEGALLTLFAGLWFASLGSGGAPLLFLVLGALVEIPAQLRTHQVRELPWKLVAAGIVRIVVAGVILGYVIG
jgi:hypothetical protein